MNRYACHFKDNKGCIILYGEDDEDVAWLAESHARMEGCQVSDIEPLDDHHYIIESPELYEE